MTLSLRLRWLHALRGVRQVSGSVPLFNPSFIGEKVMSATFEVFKR
jgi:hypothetical protein